MGWSKDPGPSTGGEVPRFFYAFRRLALKELSIFIDESGDFGEYDHRSPFYIISMVYHDQEKDIKPAIERLDNELRNLNLGDICIHTGPIIRKEEIYREMSIKDRRRIFNKMMAFLETVGI